MGSSKMQRWMLVLFVLLLTGIGLHLRRPDGSSAEPAQSTTVPSDLLEAMESPDGLHEERERAEEESGPLGTEELHAVERSQRLFRDLSQREAIEVAGEQFPELVEQPSYDPLRLAEGEKVDAFPEPNVAQLELPGGESGVVESGLPLVTEAASGKEAPVDLTLHRSETAIEPVNPLTDVRIPLELAEGISLPATDLTLSPVDASGTPIRGPATIEGAAAIYANAQPDTDVLVKPLPDGFETEAILRSPASPESLSYRIGAPGRSVDLKSGDAGSVLIESDGRLIATIPPPPAVDADGSSVPVELSVAGQTLTLNVAHRSGAFKYPILVDPTVSEKNWRYYEQGPWVFSTNSPQNFYEPFFSGKQEFPEILTNVSYGYGIWGAWSYRTQGVSRIYSFEPSVWSAVGEADQMTNLIAIAGSGGGSEIQKYLGTYVYPQQTNLLCPAAECASSGGSAGNSAVYEKIAINNGTWGQGIFQNYGVKIAQDTGSSVAFDTADKEIEGHPNPLYGSGVWLTSASEGRLKAVATDPGIGIYKRSLTAEGFSAWSGKLASGDASGCVGIQCNETYNMPANVANLPEGITTIKGTAENATGFGSFGYKTAQVKIDNSAPHAEVKGLPANFAVGRGSVWKLEVVFSDGTASVASSGVAAGTTEVRLDGEVVLAKAGSSGCTPGPCQVVRNYELHSRNLSPGVHTIKAVAQDGAGNSVSTEVPVLVKPGPSAEMGPGSLDLGTGAYSIAMNDVDPSTAGTGLSLKRTYNSQTPAPSASPFGSAWEMGLGGWQGIERLSNGIASFTDARGRSLMFTAKEGGFVPPPGYQGWSLAYDPNTSFTSTIGSEGFVNGKFMEPVDVARDPKGNLWVLDRWLSPRVQEFNKEGEFIREFGSSGTGNGQFNEASGIAADSKGNILVLDTGNYRVQKFNEKGEFIAKFGSAGSGNGQFNYPLGIDADSKGNIWVADTGNNRIQKFNEAGEYVGQVGTLGSGNGQFSAPAAVTGDFRGNVWVADTNNNRIQEFNEKLEFLRKAGTSGAGPGQMNHPRGITGDVKGNVWVTDSGNGRVQQFNEKAEYVGSFGSLGSGNAEFNVGVGIATDSSGNFWVADSGSRKLKRWLVSGGTISGASYKVTDLQGDVTTFKQPGGEGNLFLPSGTVGPNGTQGASFKFEVVGGVPRPSQVLGPVPAGVTCTTLVRGCRALTFSYDAGTSATSDEPSGWGSYKGRLHSVQLQAWDPASGSMTTKTLVNYSYDLHGRLRAVWDPRISPALKTIYGYDSTGHLTAMTPPGQQTWGFKYGTQGGETQSDWLLSVSRTKAAAPIGSGEAPANTAVPTLTNSYPKVGTTYKVWNGTWSNSPGSYGYQWKRCNASGGECVAIAGAADQSYTVVSADSGHALVAEVTATNSGGSASAVTAPSAAVGTTPPLVFGSQFGKAGTANGQFATPKGVALDASKNIWVVDSGNNRLEKFSPTGVFIAAYGSGGAGNGQFSGPTDIAINPSSGNIYVSDTGNNRIEQFTSSGTFVKAFGTLGSGNGQLNGPLGLTLDASGNVWVLDAGNKRVEEFSSSGAYMSVINGYGVLSSPKGIAVSGSTVYVSETSAYDIVWEFSAVSGALMNCICTGEAKAGSGPGEFDDPGELAADSTGRIYVSDTKNNRFQVFSSTGAFIGAYGSTGTAGGQFTSPTGIATDSSGNAWIADQANRVQKWEPFTKQTSPPAADPTTAVWTAIYRVPVSGAGAPYEMSSSAVAKWAQKAAPREATAIFPPDQVPSRMPGSYTRATMYYMDDGGNVVNTVAPGGRITTSEYDEDENLVRGLSAGNRAIALEAGSGSAAKAELLDTRFTYSFDGTDLLEVLGPQHKVKLPTGKEVNARLRTRYAYDQGAPAGGPYHLVTSESQGALISGEPEADIRKTVIAYDGQSNLGWSLREPTSTTVDPTGLNLVSRTVYDPVTGYATETRKPGNPEGGDAHATQIVYYKAGAGTPAQCGGHPEWAGLPCQVRPAAQPGTLGLPEVPTTTTQYNIWQEPTLTTVSSGSAVRTKTLTYDAAGRITTLARTASSGSPLPTVTVGYSSTQNLPVSMSATGAKGFEEALGEYNSLGQLTTYTDTEGVTSSYAYDIDGRPIEKNDGKGTQSLTYDTTTGDLVKLVDSDIGTISATYDAQGRLGSESLPDGLTSTFTYDSTGARTKVVDVKTTSCSEACTWYTDEVVPSIHGQWLKESSTRISSEFAFDAAGRLIQAQETPVGLGCVVSIYGYDADANRTSLTTRPPKEGGGCAESGGSSMSTTYDAGDRQMDAGVSYDPFGDVTELPAAYAGGSLLQSSYYVDGSLATQSQGPQSLAYRQDPLGRTVEITATGSSPGITTNHFSDAGDSPSWTADEAGNWTRYISGIDGSLAAIHTAGAEPQIQISNLHGDVVATVPLTEPAEGPTWAPEVSLTGIPRAGKPGKYGWMGAMQRSTELASGVVSLGSGNYVPQLGRALQPTETRTGSSPYVIGSGDPIDETSVNGQYSPGVPTWLEQFESHPPDLPPPPPPPSEEGAGEGELTFSEIDPVDHGEYGHLHTEFTSACSERSCDADFTFWGVITERRNRTSGMHLWITVWNPAFDQETGALIADYGTIPGIVSSKHHISLSISEGTFFIFNMFVRVGRHKETLRTAFTVVGGEISW